MPCLEPARTATDGRISGVVTDSVHVRPLIGALVFATPVGARSGEIRSAVTNDRGRYAIDSLAAGSYSTRSLVGAFCPGTQLPEGRGVLGGQITRPEDDKPLERASIVAAWTELPTYRDVTQLFMAQTGRVFADAAGEYHFCDLPTDTWLEGTAVIVGRVVSPGGQADGNQNLEPGLVNPAEVAAIEFYATSMGAPGSFKSDCGLILIWTKKRRGAELTPPP